MPQGQVDAPRTVQEALQEARAATQPISLTAGAEGWVRTASPLRTAHALVLLVPHGWVLTVRSRLRAACRARRSGTGSVPPWTSWGRLC
jgi:hypothetical protein